jgi:4-amino-4-deoxy-L-arabinose transferase-like glycosyltransferase
MYVLTGSGRTALKAMILSIFNPFLLFHAFRIWTDLFMTFFIFLSFLFAVKFKYEKKLPIFAFLSGLALTVAVLTKYQALLAIPLILFFIVKSLKKEQIPAVLAAFLIPFLLLFYWLSFLLPYKPTLQYLLSNTPSAEVLSKYPFVAYVAKRPVYYYFLSLFTVNPVNLILFVPLVRAIRTGYRPVLFTPIVKNIVMPILLFIVIVLLIFTVIGTSGSTFQSRYVLMTQPFLVLLVSLVPLRRVFLRVATGSVVFFTVLMASINIVSRSAELFSLPEMLFR